MTDNLLELAIATTGGRELWKTLRGLRIDISIGGPIWVMKGWPPEKTFDPILTLDTAKEHIVFTPFTRPDQQMVFDALQVATRRRVFRRNPDNTVNLNLPSITLDIHDVELISHNEKVQP